MPKLQNALWDQLIAEFPPLWNPQDLCFRDLHVRNQCRQLLLEKANRVSSVPISMEALRRRLRNVNKRLRNGRYRETLGSENTLLIPSQTSQLTSTNPDSTQEIIASVSLRELAADYPCLWDSQDVNYVNALMRTNCEEQLLVKYNNLSRTPITMSQLQQKLQHLRQEREGGMSSFTHRAKERVHWNELEDAFAHKWPTEERSPQEERSPPGLPSWGRLEDLSAEYPCLWDRKAPGYYNHRVNNLCLKQLLDKYNSQSSYRITYSQLRTMIESMRRRQRRRVAAPRAEDTRADCQSDVGNSSDSTDQANLNNQTAVLSIVFHCCAVCGEVKSECLNQTDKCYIENNKTTLKMNNMSVDLNFDEDATICQNCDEKLKEMHDFFKLVKNAQDKINGVDIADVIAIDDENEDQKLIIDELTVTDTELVKPTVSHKRKGDETPELKKKCRVTIDLNSCDDDKSTMDDIAKYQMFKNDGIVMESKDADEVLSVKDTGDGEDVNFHIKEEIETDDIHEEVDETVEMSTDDDKSNIVSTHTDSENVIKNSEADDKNKEVESSKIVNQEDKRNDIEGNGEVVTKGDKRNGVMDDHANDTEITSAAVSIVNALASKEPVCVMPKSELIGLVESIVSRMLNK